MGHLALVDSFYSIFHNKRIFITGDTGFKGSWLSLWLRELGADVVGYALPPQLPQDHFNLLDLSSVIHHIDGDIRDLPKMASITEEFQPEIVFHLAAQSLVRLSYGDPKLTFDTNVGGSVNVLEIIRNTPSVRSAIYVTSDKCYSNKEWVWGYRENDELGGRDPYSASKAAAEIAFSAYANSYFKNREGLGVASVRAGNVIGGGDWNQDRIVPDSIKALSAGQMITLRNPEATRPWQHVLEPLSGYMKLAACLYQSPKLFSGAWNFGPRINSVKTVRDLAGEITNCWGAGTIEEQSETNAVHEAGLLSLNCDKAASILRWYPKWDFNRTIAETISWYKQVHEGESASSISKSQIMRYMED